MYNTRLDIIECRFNRKNSFMNVLDKKGLPKPVLSGGHFEINVSPSLVVDLRTEQTNYCGMFYRRETAFSKCINLP